MRLDKILTSIPMVFLIYSTIVIVLSLCFPYLSSVVFPNTDAGLYNKQFWSNFLTNANSSIIDFFVIGAVIYAIQKRNDHKLILKNSHQELEDYASHSSIELNLKKMGIIRRLIESGERELSIKRLALGGIAIKDLTLMSSELIGLSFYESSLTNCTFSRCNIRSLNLEKVKAKKLTFTDCTINNLRFNYGKFTAITFENVDLTNSSLFNATIPSGMFKNCNFSGVNFEGANLRSANIKSSYNIDINSLCKAKCLDYIVAEDSIIAEIKNRRPDVKFSR
ncbi:hypothetical protein L580_0348 [Serratia fonticola AU-P3(3)]|nr:hypothetical protein L580_0348 [Serratia fonticola AU-P3(3)]